MNWLITADTMKIPASAARGPAPPPIALCQQDFGPSGMHHLSGR
ncbi:MAG TPA: hypothetical protein VFW65_15190 [Pseudonocardiaceae bacterium]|nr:hypothetical protein [Pseudonocardiaceae bacterium]